MEWLSLDTLLSSFLSWKEKAFPADNSSVLPSCQMLLLHSWWVLLRNLSPCPQFPRQHYLSGLYMLAYLHVDLGFPVHKPCSLLEQFTFFSRYLALLASLENLCEC